MDDNRPNFFIIGHPKCGTTSLWRWMGRQPQVRMSRLKEPHFFCADLHRASDRFHGRSLFFPVRNHRQYHALFTGPRCRVLGDASPCYLFSAEAVRRILAYNPDARFLVLLRHPIRFLHSFHAQLVAGGQETLLDLPEALAAEPRRRAGKDVPPTAICPQMLWYTEWLRFDMMLDRLFAQADPTAIKVIVFEELVACPERILTDLARWLGIPKVRMIPLPRENSSGSEPLLGTVVRRLFPPKIQRAVKRLFPLGLDTEVWLGARSGLKRLSRRQRTLRRHDAEVRRMLRPLLVEVVANTEDLLGRRITAWAA